MNEMDYALGAGTGQAFQGPVNPKQDAMAFLRAAANASTMGAAGALSPRYQQALDEDAQASAFASMLGDILGLGGIGGAAVKAGRSVVGGAKKLKKLQDAAKDREYEQGIMSAIDAEVAKNAAARKGFRREPLNRYYEAEDYVPRQLPTPMMDPSYARGGARRLQDDLDVEALHEALGVPHRSLPRVKGIDADELRFNDNITVKALQKALLDKERAVTSMAETMTPADARRFLGDPQKAIKGRVDFDSTMKQLEKTMKPKDTKAEQAKLQEFKARSKGRFVQDDEVTAEAIQRNLQGLRDRNALRAAAEAGTLSPEETEYIRAWMSLSKNGKFRP